MTLNLKKSLVAGLLVAGTVLAVAGGTKVKAATTGDSEASITFNGWIPPGGNEQREALELIGVSNLRFGSFDLNNVATNTQLTSGLGNYTFEAKKVKRFDWGVGASAVAVAVDNDGDVKPEIRVRDTRNLSTTRNQSTGWKVAVKMESKFDNLAGAMLKLKLVQIAKDTRDDGSPNANHDLNDLNDLNRNVFGANDLEINTNNLVVFGAHSQTSKGNVEGFFDAKLEIPKITLGTLSGIGDYSRRLTWELTDAYADIGNQM